MAETLSLDDFFQLLRAVANRIIAERKELTDLDAAIGDGDFGTSLSTGFSKVLAQLETMEKTNYGDALKKVGMTLTSTVGGVSGPIWGSAFMRAGLKAGELKEADPKNIAEIFNAALEGIQARGKAQPGDKTLVDALHPAIQAMQQVAEREGSVRETFEKGLEAARKGSDATIDMVAQKGRASYLGERTRGHRDAGSWAIVLIFKELVTKLKK